MKNGSSIVKLVFGVLGAVYTVLGSAFLAAAAKAAGDIRRIFTLTDAGLTFATLGTVFTALGIAFLLVTHILGVADWRRARLREELLIWGGRATGIVTEVRVDYTIRVNRRSPVIAKVQCPLPSGEVTLKSHRLWDILPAVGDRAEVIYDPMDEKKYVIEFPDEN